VNSKGICNLKINYEAEAKHAEHVKNMNEPACDMQHRVSMLITAFKRNAGTLQKFL
jgi:hypothetical protein